MSLPWESSSSMNCHGLLRPRLPHQSADWFAMTKRGVGAALVRNDEGGSLRWSAMTKKGAKNPPRKKQLFRGGYRTSQEG